MSRQVAAAADNTSRDRLSNKQQQYVVSTAPKSILSSKAVEDVPACSSYMKML